MEKVLKDIVAINPPFFEEPIKTISTLFETKHWFELGKALIDLLNQPGLVGEKITLYQGYISFCAELLDPLHHAQIIHLVSEDYSSPQSALEFIRRSLSFFDKRQDARDWLSLQMVSHYIINGEFETALSLVTEIDKHISDLSSILVKSLFYKVQSTLDKARGDYDSFYEHALLYLSTSRQYSDVVLAYDLCTSALISKKVCSFSELANHPIILTLDNVNTNNNSNNTNNNNTNNIKGNFNSASNANSNSSGENKWMLDLIRLLDNGSPTIIQEFNSKFLPIIESKPQFSNYVEDIKFKVTISVLMQLVFQRPFESRVFSFDEVCQVCQIPKNMVEFLVLKALSAQIIKGFIDEVDERIVITWCKPKALGIVRLQHLKDQIDRWIQRVHEQKVLLEIKSQAVVG